jgi:asparagine synthase (glutamine-hydrolysing)
MVDLLTGMYAIAIYDAIRDEAILIRDRLGKKPLCYFVSADCLVFASELNALRAHPSCPSEIDAGVLAAYLTFNSVPAPGTLLRHVQKVPPGSAVTVRKGRQQLWRYWEPHLEVDARAAVSPADIHANLVRAVRERMAVDGSMGVLLSGGIDSSLVAAIAARESKATLFTYSARFPDAASFDETRHALHAASALSTRHTIVDVSLPSLAGAALAILPSLDEPIADHSLLPTVLLCRRARRDVKAILTGDGADEFVMGYGIFQATAAIDAIVRVVPRKRLAQLFTWIGRRDRSESNLSFRHVVRLLAQSIMAPAERQFSLAAAAFVPQDWRDILTPEIGACATPDVFSELDRVAVAHPNANRAELLQLGMICHFLRDVILTKLDRASMLESIEARSPFLDDALVEQFLRMPFRMKMHRFHTKRVVRLIARDYLPRSLTRRRKQGFRVPIARLLRSELREFLRDSLSFRAVRDSNLLRPSKVGQMIDEHLSGARDHHRQLWSILCLQAWANRRPGVGAPFLPVPSVAR